jgi:hypothetical protein
MVNALSVRPNAASASLFILIPPMAQRARASGAIWIFSGLVLGDQDGKGSRCGIGPRAESVHHIGRVYAKLATFPR